MALSASNILIYLTGGTGNTDPNLSLGGTISTTQIVDATLHNLYDYVSSDEALAGDIEYRAIKYKNTHPTDTAYGVVIYIQSDTTSPDTSLAIAYDSAGTQSVVNESTAPSAPALTFSSPSSKATGIAIGNVAASATFTIWTKWIVNASAAGYANDTTALRISVDYVP